MGVYKIFVKTSPSSDFPPFFTVDQQGTSQPAIIKNGMLITTSVEIEFAYNRCDYKDIYLLEAVVSSGAG